ncbi:hypothetical protein RCL_jg23119.t1 [Rhizophagus clarus]|uniref:Uncharacterized protein n=1 Tax=Rhizophagus clarus TaxID=94130 RepID=A0A8H3L569_9GLOM|nr:hypothetical protein RCL_jg23119.t1 [Rhizophagus clarus]
MFYTPIEPYLRHTSQSHKTTFKRSSSDYTLYNNHESKISAEITSKDDDDFKIGVNSKIEAKARGMIESDINDATAKLKQIIQVYLKTKKIINPKSRDKNVIFKLLSTTVESELEIDKNMLLTLLSGYYSVKCSD